MESQPTWAELAKKLREINLDPDFILFLARLRRGVNPEVVELKEGFYSDPQKKSRRSKEDKILDRDNFLKREKNKLKKIYSGEEFKRHWKTYLKSVQDMEHAKGYFNPSRPEESVKILKENGEIRYEDHPDEGLFVPTGEKPYAADWGYVWMVRAYIEAQTKKIHWRLIADILNYFEKREKWEHDTIASGWHYNRERFEKIDESTFLCSALRTFEHFSEEK